MREINLGFDSVAFNAAGALRRAARFLSVASAAEIGAHFVSFVVFQRTGMRLFFGDANYG
jgi:hypothetical protein